MMSLRVIFFLVLFFCFSLHSSYSQITEPDSSSSSERRIDSLNNSDSLISVKTVTGKILTDNSSDRYPFNLVIIDGVVTPAAYSNAFYLGAIIDINGQKMKNGTAGIALQYRRLQKLNKMFGINFLSSLTIFYNASEDRYYHGEISSEGSGSKFTENYFMFNLHLAPSFSTPYGELIYAGLGVTYLKGRVFENSITGPYLILAPYNERTLFSQVIGLEKEVTPELCLNFEYQHTEYNDFFALKLGKRF